MPRMIDQLLPASFTPSRQWPLPPFETRQPEHAAEDIGSSSSDEIPSSVPVALPLAAGVWTRNRLGSAERIEAFRDRIKPWGVVGLIATVVILFGLQGQVILDRPAVIALIAVPILIQSYGIFALAYGAAFALRVPHRIAAPCAMIGTSNFFELAVAVAISLFGLNSGAALATVVGVLVEVPVMLSLVAFANRTRNRFAEG